METSSLEQILIYPYITEITPTLNRLTAETNSPHQKMPKRASSPLPMLTIRKSAGETNDEKGSTNLILVPHSYLENNEMKHALYNIDYTPVKPRS